MPPQSNLVSVISSTIQLRGVKHKGVAMGQPAGKAKGVAHSSQLQPRRLARRHYIVYETVRCRYARRRGRT